LWIGKKYFPGFSGATALLDRVNATITKAAALRSKQSDRGFRFGEGAKKRSLSLSSQRSRRKGFASGAIFSSPRSNGPPIDVCILAFAPLPILGDGALWIDDMAAP